VWSYVERLDGFVLGEFAVDAANNNTCDNEFGKKLHITWVSTISK
jgi:hypothetical protein